MEYKSEWNLSPLFSGDNDIKISERRKECEERVSAFVKKWKGRDGTEQLTPASSAVSSLSHKVLNEKKQGLYDYLKEPDLLAEALDEYENWMANFGTGT